ncbi:zinc-ribbon domain-containing protein [Zhengella sp. ZM62]|uniref:zinc ribbon domain-containing protein n=1 Tax=Zhengella sedimenti TaxID=3390035 RepID=UPI003974DF59
MALQCAHCGEKLEPGDQFCPSCGAKADQEAGTPPPGAGPIDIGRAVSSGSRWAEILRRIVPLASLVLLYVSLALGDYLWAGIAAVAAVLFYLLPPRIRPPQGAYAYERIPAVIGPDILGFFLTSAFIGLPLVARAIEGGHWDDLLEEIHPSAVLVWPMALISLVILVIAYRNASFWLRIEQDGLRVRRSSGERFAAYSAIRQVDLHRRGLPRWIKALTPFLILGGKYGAAGSIMLARDETGIRLDMRDGTSITIAADALEKALLKVLAALKAHGVEMTPDLKEALA